MHQRIWRERTPRRRRRQGGFSIVETMLALIIFTLMTMMVAAVLPTAARSSRMGNDYSQAVTVVLHKINQLQETGYSRMTGPQLGQSGLDVVDGTPSSPASNANGDQSASFEFTTTDNLLSYFPGSNGGDANSKPHGYIDIAPWTPSASTDTSSGTPVTIYGMIQATVRIVWTDTHGASRNFSMTTLIPRTPML